jgi:TPR repeat protein
MNTPDNKNNTDETVRKFANQRAIIGLLVITVFFAALGSAVGIAIAPNLPMRKGAPMSTVQEGVAAFEAGDFKEALAKIQPAAEKGNAQAAYWMGQMYENGLGVKMDAGTALTWYQKAAEGGWADAKFKLGEIYFTGTEDLQDFAKARKWLEQSAHDGNSRAQLDLGQLYANGWGGDKDQVQAYVWYEFAAKQGNLQAQHLRDELIKVMPEKDIAQAQNLAEKMAAQALAQGKDETKGQKAQHPSGDELGSSKTAGDESG